MSGGAMDYLYYAIEEQCVGKMHDNELDELMKDIAELVHDCEWWLSDDTSEEDYRATVAKFKQKWFKSSREERLERIIEEKCNALKEELKKML